MSPMFKQYRSNWRQWHVPEVRAQINMPQAIEMEKAVSLLPSKNREAIRWHYVWESSPGGKARDLGVSKQGLAELVRVGRVMLQNGGM